MVCAELSPWGSHGDSVSQKETGCYFCLECSRGGFILSTKAKVDVNAPANGTSWRILAAALFSQVSAIFPKTSSLWSRRDTERSSSTSSVWASRHRHREGWNDCYFPMRVDKMHVSTAPAPHRPSTCFLRWLSCVTFTLCRPWKNYRRYERPTGFPTVCVLSFKVFVCPLEPPSQSGRRRRNLHGSWELRPWALHLFDWSVWCLCNQSTAV